MAKPSTQSFDVTGFVENAASQFRSLNGKEPGQWPPLPKIATWLATCLAVIGFGWLLLLSDATDELEQLRLKEPTLKAAYKDRLGQAVNLSEYRKQKLQVQEYVTQLEKQLPGKAEMDALLSDINQAGLGRGLQFELFRPGQIQVKDYYAELPIAIRVTGRYHDVGSFAADVANLSRIVTLQNLAITPVGPRDTSGILAMEATARTYRYLDASEIAAQRKPPAAKPGAPR
ncbi:MAG: type 4a pilus biogenesis protein PilO [Rubrivivax sp.]|nr:type 4a pilus biogenesis protein PilO [Rubrivivax sp.]